MDIGRAVIKAKQMGVTFNRVISQPSQRALIEFRAPPMIPRIRECVRVRKICVRYRAAITTQGTRCCVCRKGLISYYVNRVCKLASMATWSLRFLKGEKRDESSKYLAN